MTYQEAKDRISELVNRFSFHLTEYKKGHYNETQTRNDFINPFFEALGWDIHNKAGLAENYREVIHEDKIKISGSTKAPDYCFTIYGQKKFFVEAKKPGINIKEEIDPAYQLRRYGWSAKMPISVITDFEEFSIYDCTIKPSPSDKPSVSRIKYLTYKDYIKEFDFLWDTFSKEMVLKGSFDKFVTSTKGKKGTAGVDAEFVKSLDTWRDLLARNIVNRNPKINEDELNYSMQKIIDRLIFLRICEDRGIEPEGQIKDTIDNNIYNKLKIIFHNADQKYNSGLFDYTKDKITDNLNVDDKILKSIIEEMYYPKCPYEFSVIPVEILGHSYEQYLGKVIRITPGHRIVIEVKPEVRKAGGVYYTPQYIVDYIVKNTVGKLVEGKTPEEVSKIKICDPACGSGSFLLGAYQYLLDWHREYYLNTSHKWFTVESPNSMGKHGTPLTPDGNLTTAVKKQILLNNIFGVDIDTNAVEVTKLSLMLKAIEGETEASINNQLSFFHDRVLPTLDNNIKCGNSLIDVDFYDSHLDFEPGVLKKIKPFNWESAFPEVFKEKVKYYKAYHITWVTHNSRVSQRMKTYEKVIIRKRMNKGLQPLVQGWFLDEELEIAVTKVIADIIYEDNIRIIAYNICGDHIHILVACHEDDLTNLVRKLKGKSSQLIKNLLEIPPETEFHLWAQKFNCSFVENDHELNNKIEYINNNRKKHGLPINVGLQSIIQNMLTPLADAFTPVVVKGGFDAVIGNPPYVKYENLDRNLIEYSTDKYFCAKNFFDIYQIFLEKSYYLLKNCSLMGFILPNLFLKGMNYKNSRKFFLENTSILIIHNFGDGVFENVQMPTCIIIFKKCKDNNNEIKFVKKIKNEYKYHLINQEKIKKDNYIYDDITIIDRLYISTSLLKESIQITRGLEIGRDKAKIRNSNSNDISIIFGEDISRYTIKNISYISNEIYQSFRKSEEIFKNPKLIIRETGSRITASFDESGILTNRSLYCIRSEKMNLYFLLGILNSNLIQYFYINNFKSETDIFPKIRIGQVKEIPIKKINFSNPAEKAQHDQLVNLVETMLQLHKDLQTATLPEQKEQIKARIEYTDKKIDQLVYKLYELTDEEIRIVEGE